MSSAFSVTVELQDLDLIVDMMGESFVVRRRPNLRMIIQTYVCHGAHHMILEKPLVFGKI